MENEVKKWGSLLDTGWKIITALIVIISGIVSVVFAWIQIETNTSDIAETKRDALREITIQEDRNEKRFQRSTEWNAERKREFEKLEERVRWLERELAFERGKTDIKK